MFIGIDVGLKLARSGRHRRRRRSCPGVSPTPPRASRPSCRPWRTLDPDLIVLEATGTYHQPLLAALLVAEVPVGGHQPGAVRRLPQAATWSAQDGSCGCEAAGPLRRTAPRGAAPGHATGARFGAIAPVGGVSGRSGGASRRRSATGSTPPRGPAAPTVLAWLADDLAQLAARLKQVERGDRGRAGDDPGQRRAHGAGRRRAADGGGGAGVSAGWRARARQGGGRLCRGASTAGAVWAARPQPAEQAGVSGGAAIPVPGRAVRGALRSRSCGPGTRRCVRGARRPRARCARWRTSCCGR